MLDVMCLISSRVLDEISVRTNVILEISAQGIDISIIFFLSVTEMSRIILSLGARERLSILSVGAAGGGLGDLGGAGGGQIFEPVK